MTYVEVKKKLGQSNENDFPLKYSFAYFDKL